MFETDDSPGSRKDPSKPSGRSLLIGVLLLFLAWGIHQDKFTLNWRAGSPLGKQAAGEPLQVHPEVLNLQESFAKVSETVKPAVVNIATVHVEKMQNNPYEFFFMDPEDLFEQFFNVPPQPRSRKRPQPQTFQRRIPGTGSGVIIDPDGFILTNEHVVRGADEIKVTLSDNPEKKYDGKVIGRDERTDLAVVKIRASKSLPFAKLGDSNGVRVGDWAIAIGSPFGLEQTVTVGVISASRQNLPIEGRTYKDLIQTDAAINPGNSGGPLVNIHGEVIGINTAIYTPSGGFAGIGFAIPIDRAKEIIPQLREKGKVIRGWIGVMLEDEISEATAKVFGVQDKQGAMVRDVLPNYPAAKAGLKRGDVIREFAGKKVKNNADLQALVAATPPNKAVSMKIIRNRKEMDLELTTAEAPEPSEALKETSPGPEAPDKGSQTTWLGGTFAELSPGLREPYAIPEQEKGVVVLNLEPGSKAEEAGLLQGDLIRGVNQEPTPDLKAFKEATAKVRTREGVVFDVLRRGEPRYLSYMGPEK